MRIQRRTTLAAALIAAAVLLPTSAWYLSGSAEANRRAEAIKAEAAATVQEEVIQEANHLDTRLEELRQKETNRHFLHYQTLYYDPRFKTESFSVTPSPLASGTTDPLIWAHFQIDENGVVNLPSVNDRFPELNSSSDFDTFCNLLSELQNAMVVADDLAGIRGSVDAEGTFTFTEAEWKQILLAETFYDPVIPASAADPTLSASRNIGRVAVTVKPLQWQTLILGSGSTLAAMREVRTPAGILLQGFTIASEGVAFTLNNSNLPLSFTPFSAGGDQRVTAPVGNTGWLLEADSSEKMALATTQSRETVIQFRQTFIFIASAIILTAAAVVLILFQTDRLANQRARFAAAAAHELKTPLSGLLLHAEMLDQELGNPERRAAYASTIVSEAGRLGRVVNNMLDLSRLERGALHVTLRSGDLGAAVVSCTERIRPQLEKLDVRMNVKIPKDLPQVSFDHDALCQILDNLLDNAEKHTRGRPDRKISVDLVSDNDCVRLEVTDTGPGIPRHLRRTLFQPFKRYRAADCVPGLGLGLALARSLAIAQGGELKLETTGKPGATFVLTLPST